VNLENYAHEQPVEEQFFSFAGIQITMASVCVTETELFPSPTNNSYELSSYIDTSLYSNPPAVFYLPCSALKDAVSNDVMAENDVKYAALESSPSVVTLLNDKLDFQSKVNFCAQASIA